MPYYSWKGVNLRARWCKGRLFARSERELDALLFKKDIALVYVAQKKLRKKRVCEQEVANYFIQLHTLAKAGVMIPEALNTIASYTAHPYFSSVCYEVADQVAQGVPLAPALARFPQIFSPIAIQVVGIGQESGSLPQSLGVLVHYLESVLSFKKKLRSAFLLPAVTFVFFLMIIGVILVVIVPQFISLCATMQKQVPHSTQMLLDISNFLRSKNALFVGGILGSGAWLGLRYTKTGAGKIKWDSFLLAIPVLKKLIIYQVMAVFFRSIAQLQQGGMPLAKALAISAESVEYAPIKERLVYVASAVDAGMPFSASLHECADYLDQTAVALISVGQETGKLPEMLTRVADSYQERLLSQMQRITTLAQPFLLVVLGLLIGMLILGLYAPIMSLSSII
ncbi:type II secretion system F family protein [soil metagenome]